MTYRSEIVSLVAFAKEHGAKRIDLVNLAKASDIKNVPAIVKTKLKIGGVIKKGERIYPETDKEKNKNTKNKNRRTYRHAWSPGNHYTEFMNAWQGDD